MVVLLPLAVAISERIVTCRHAERPCTRTRRSIRSATFAVRVSLTVTFAACLHGLRAEHRFGVTLTSSDTMRVAATGGGPGVLTGGCWRGRGCSGGGGVGVGSIFG